VSTSLSEGAKPKVKAKIAFELELQERSLGGSPAARRMRGLGQIPSVVYSQGGASTPVALNYREFMRVASISRTSQVFTLKSTQVKDLNGRIAVVKEIQKDHLKNRVLHVDLQALREDEEVKVAVPLNVVGEAPGVKTDGGILAVVSREILVKCFPLAIPQELIVDVSSLALGESIHARDLGLPKGVKLAGNPDETIVAVVIARTNAEDEAAATAAAAATATAAATAAPTEGGAAAAAPAAAAPAAAAKAKK
jgi:large subunit ribosomal protein L25